nr:TolC family protein [Crocinitomicaceae bacterium]
GNQLKQLLDAAKIEEIHFHYLLNTKVRYLPNRSENKLQVKGNLDKSVLIAHPTMKLLDTEIQSAIAQLNLEKAKLLPSINVGVVSGTMYGFGADNNFYTHTSRFTAGQVGVSLPLFSKQGSVIKSAKINTQIVQNNALSERVRIQNQFEALLIQFDSQRQIISELEGKALPNARIIFETAQKQFVNGEIDYLQWALLINQSISIQSDYQDALMKYNELAIEMIYLGN